MKKTVSVILAVIMMAGIFVLSGAAAKAEIYTFSGTDAGGINSTVSVTASTDRWSAVSNSYIYTPLLTGTAAMW